ncbi:hypothetical protein B7463_g8917, partial [Scytalidium lignicola]
MPAGSYVMLRKLQTSGTGQTIINLLYLCTAPSSDPDRGLGGVPMPISKRFASIQSEDVTIDPDTLRDPKPWKVEKTE